jgi:hypothetical protein
VGTSVAVRAGREMRFEVGDASLVLKSNGDIVLKGKSISIEASGNLRLRGSKVLTN